MYRLPNGKIILFDNYLYYNNIKISTSNILYTKQVITNQIISPTVTLLNLSLSPYRIFDAVYITKHSEDNLNIIMSYDERKSAVIAITQNGFNINECIGGRAIICNNLYNIFQTANNYSTIATVSSNNLYISTNEMYATQTSVIDIVYQSLYIA